MYGVISINDQCILKNVDFFTYLAPKILQVEDIKVRGSAKQPNVSLTSGGGNNLVKNLVQIFNPKAINLYGLS